MSACRSVFYSRPSVPPPPWPASKRKVIYACNVADGDLAEGNELVDQVRKFADEEGARVVVVSAQVESELVDLDGDDKREFLESLGAVCFTSRLLVG